MPFLVADPAAVMSSLSDHPPSPRKKIACRKDGTVGGGAWEEEEEDEEDEEDEEADDEDVQEVAEAGDGDGCGGSVRREWTRARNGCGARECTVCVHCDCACLCASALYVCTVTVHVSVRVHCMCAL